MPSVEQREGQPEHLPESPWSADPLLRRLARTGESQSPCALVAASLMKTFRKVLRSVIDTM